jgi:hypothetical protein
MPIEADNMVVMIPLNYMRRPERSTLVCDRVADEVPGSIGDDEETIKGGMEYAPGEGEGEEQ